MSLRARRICLRLVIHGSVAAMALLGLLLGQLSSSPGVSFIFGLALVGYLVTLRVNPLPRLLERSLFQEVECFSCGQVMDLVNNWGCACGFQTWYPRHCLSPCAYCHRVYAWLQCPHCESGILT